MIYQSTRPPTGVSRAVPGKNDKAGDQANLNQICDYAQDRYRFYSPGLRSQKGNSHGSGYDVKRNKKGICGPARQIEDAGLGSTFTNPPGCVVAPGLHQQNQPENNLSRGGNKEKQPVAPPLPKVLLHVEPVDESGPQAQPCGPPAERPCGYGDRRNRLTRLSRSTESRILEQNSTHNDGDAKAADRSVDRFPGAPGLPPSQPGPGGFSG